MSTTPGRARTTAMAALTLLLAAAGEARAQGFISPFVGYDFGGDAGCPQITGCEDNQLNAGVTLGVTGSVFGFEEEFAYAKDFFGSTQGFSSSVLTVMTNVMLIPNVGPVRPYGLAGVGLIKTHIELSPSSVFSADNNGFGWDVGGGVMVTLARHFGLRGDLRYFHSFQDTALLGIVTLNGEKLDFGRVSGAVVFRF